MLKTFVHFTAFSLAISALAIPVPAQVRRHRATPTKASALTLTQEEASHFARLALTCVRKEYPNKLDHVMNDAAEVKGPRALHPAFYGCFDWHSCVHGHWMLVHLLRLFPNMPEAGEIRSVLNDDLTEGNIKVETEYLGQANRQSFERTYGWAWLLKLAEELHDWNDPDAGRWSRNLQPLANAIAAQYVSFLPKQTYPIRTGVHPNTAFGLTFAYDYARSVGDNKLESVVRSRGLDYFAKDANYPAEWEPGGMDFLSPALEEADLMRRVMGPTQFARWFHRFLPGIPSGRPASLLRPAIVSDRSDPTLVHLDGLNLSKAWCMRQIAASLPALDPAGPVLVRAAKEVATDGLAHVSSGQYVGEHWLATFAVYMFSVSEP